ncbi:MAG: tripartite tricarboxylate transporter substrate binding protein [Deltaproteobacteria bacterium]|nr:tripartite tricarboxylate transporter substrate binding protein [Deltaproteobacteria bacterium]
MRWRRSITVSLGLLSMLTLSPPLARAAGATFPERPITIVVGQDPGGVTDILVRALASVAEKSLGKPVIVDNKGGGGGAVALGWLVGQKPDGYNLAAVQNVSIVDTSLLQKVPYKPLASFTPIAAVGRSENTSLIVRSDAPWKTWDEFLDYAKKNPGKIKYSTAGVGTGMHVAMEVIAKKEGVNWVHIPHKGSAPARIALLGGHVDACSSGVDWPSYVQSGQVRVLLTHGRQRVPEPTGVPTLKELGYGYVNDTMHSIVAPAGVPAEAVKKLEEAFKKAAESPEVLAVMKKVYVGPAYMGSQDYTQHLKTMWTTTEKLFKDSGIIKEAASQPY